MPGFQPLSTEEAKSRFEKYGYRVSEDFVYQGGKAPVLVYDLVNNTYVNLSINKLRNDVYYGRREEYTPLPPLAYENAPIAPVPARRLFNHIAEINYTKRERNSFYKWLSKQSNEVQQQDHEQQLITYDMMQTTTKQFSKHNTFQVNFSEPNKTAQLTGFVEAMKITAPRCI